MFKLHFYKYNEYNVIRMLKRVKLPFLTHMVDVQTFSMFFNTILWILNFKSAIMSAGIQKRGM